MVKVSVETIPEKREKKEISDKYKKVVEDRNKNIAKLFKTPELDVNLKLYDSKGQLVSKLGPNNDGMGVFAGYADGSDDILIMHPDALYGLISDIDKEMLVFIDYTLVKFYLCKKYYPKKEDFNLYYKYVSESLARVTAGNLHEGSIKFDMKIHFDGKKYRKDQELDIVFYIMFKTSGIDYIYEHLDLIMKDCDIKKSINTIYKKNLTDLIKPFQEEIKLEEKKKFELERAKRQAAREKAINSSA